MGNLMTFPTPHAESDFLRFFVYSRLLLCGQLSNMEPVHMLLIFQLHYGNTDSGTAGTYGSR